MNLCPEKLSVPVAGKTKACIELTPSPPAQPVSLPPCRQLAGGEGWGEGGAEKTFANEYNKPAGAV
ncbi:MAG: hypothetical protein C4567_14425 [Deltaproteobacteria bacterium]|nr:MAG: hypothetical protein C4567_14425 [Deltaproteobacteria bacterium]